MDIALIVGSIAAIIVIYIIYRNFFASKGATTLTSQHPGTSSQSVAAASVTGSNAANYSFSIWMYIENWGYNYGQQKMVLERGNGAVQVYLGEQMNNLVFQTNLQQSNGDTATPPTAKCTLENIPLQTWTNLVIVV